MHEIDIGVRAQKVAPHALARMRLAGNEQHLQLVAHAIDRQHRAVVDGGEFVRQRRHLDLDDVGAAMFDAHGNRQIRAGNGRQGRDLVAVAAHAHRHGIARAGRVEHARADREVLADDAEARRFGQFDAPVAFALMSRDEDMQGRAEPELIDAFGNVVNDAIRHHDDAAEPFRRHVREAALQSGKQSRAIVVGVGAAGVDHPRLDIAERGKLLLDRVARGIGLRGAVADRLAGAAIENDGDDIVQRLALFPHKGRIGERDEQREQRDSAQPRTRPPRENGERDGEKADDAKRDEDGDRDLRGEGEVEGVHVKSSASQISIEQHRLCLQSPTSPDCEANPGSSGTFRRLDPGSRFARPGKWTTSKGSPLPRTAEGRSGVQSATVSDGCCEVCFPRTQESMLRNSAPSC